MAMVHQTIVVIMLLSLAITATTTPLTNITVEGPDGITTHGVPNLLCVPTKWTDVIIFFLGNYAAHVATVKIYPGEASFTVAVCLVAALLFPASGGIRGLTSIVRFSAFTKDPLRKAARSGALCMVVRSPDWEPLPGDTVRAGVGTHSMKFNGFETEVPFTTQTRFSPASLRLVPVNQPFFHWADVDAVIPVGSNEIPIVMTSVPHYARDASPYWTYTETRDFYVNDRTIYGNVELPRGYEIAFVPNDAIISPLRGTFSPELPSSHSTTKAIVALLQSLYASFTLFHSRGDPISRYGYAAFGLTVAPYAFMSTLNLFSNVLTPDYAAMYLVRSEVMDEAMRRGGKFDYVVGEMTSVPNPDAIPGTFVPILGTVEAMPDDPERLRLHLDSTVPLSPDSDVPFLRVERGTPLLVRTKPSTDVPSTIYRPIIVPACPEFQSATPRRYINKWATASIPTPVQMLVFLLTQAVPFALIGGLSYFHKGRSTLAQRVWTMLWLVLGFTIGFVAALFPSYPLAAVSGEENRVAELANRAFVGTDVGHQIFGPASARQSSRPALVRYTPRLATSTRTFLVVTLFYGVPAFGGFVVVGKMLREYGSCVNF